MNMEVRVRGVRQLRRRMTDLSRRVENELPDNTSRKIANATAGAIRRHMTMSGIRRKSGTLWQSWQPKQNKKGVWYISPTGTEPSGLPTAWLASILDRGSINPKYGFRPGLGGRHGEGWMVSLEQAGARGWNLKPHRIRPRGYFEGGFNEGRTRARGIAENEASKLIRQVFR